MPSAPHDALQVDHVDVYHVYVSTGGDVDGEGVAVADVDGLALGPTDTDGDVERLAPADRDRVRLKEKDVDIDAVGVSVRDSVVLVDRDFVSEGDAVSLVVADKDIV